MDTNTGEHTIYKDGIEVESGDWTNESQIVYSLDGLTSGDYSFEITGEDEYENSISDSVTVKILSITTTTTTKAATSIGIWMSLTGIFLMIRSKKTEK
ncbi:MAG: hypothetical protein ACTSRD_13745 [Promethearchaeota archaeon]